MALFDSKAKTISQLQRTIDEKSASMNRYFDEIGRLYYGQYRDKSVNVNKDINSRCEAISALYLDIEASKLKILFEQGLKVCAKCKSENPLEHAFCSSCGTKFPAGSDTNVEIPSAIPPADDSVKQLIEESKDAEVSKAEEKAEPKASSKTKKQ